MKQKPDESPDQWVRQIISQLPDCPPPGSSFDRERLWAQLRPELQVQPLRRKTRWMWLLAAACLAGLVLGWLWLPGSTPERRAMAMHGKNRKTEAPTENRHKLNSKNEIARPKSVVGEKESPKLGARSRRKERPSADAMPHVDEPMEVVAQITDPPIVADVLSIGEKRAEPNKSNVAVATPKRRFRLVHENELRAEEETQPKLYRPENFVRIGTGDPSASDESRPTLTLPLTHKPNQ